MARTTFNRRPAGVNTPSSNDIKQNYFNHFNWKGINQNRNFLAVDQETFADANNVYVDDEGLLKSRLPLKFKYRFEDKEIKDVKVFGDIILCSYLNTSGEWCIGIIENEKWIVDVNVFVDYPLKAFRNGNYIYIFTNSGIFSYNTDDKTLSETKMYDPVTRIYTGSNFELSQDENLFSNYSKYRYLLYPTRTGEWVSDGINPNLYGKTGTYTHFINEERITHEIEIDADKDFLNIIHQPLLYDTSHCYTTNVYGIITSTMFIVNDQIFRIYNNVVQKASTSDGLFVDIYEEKTYTWENFVKIKYQSNVGYILIIYKDAVSRISLTGEQIEEGYGTYGKMIIDAYDYKLSYLDTVEPSIHTFFIGITADHDENGQPVNYYLTSNYCTRDTYNIDKGFGDIELLDLGPTLGDITAQGEICVAPGYFETTQWDIGVSLTFIDTVGDLVKYFNDFFYIHNAHLLNSNSSIYANNGYMKFVPDAFFTKRYFKYIKDSLSFDYIFLNEYNSINNSVNPTGDIGNEKSLRFSFAKRYHNSKDVNIYTGLPHLISGTRPSYTLRDTFIISTETNKLDRVYYNGISYRLRENRLELYYEKNNMVVNKNITDKAGIFVINSWSPYWFYLLEKENVVLSNYRISTQPIDVKIEKNNQYQLPDIVIKSNKIFLSKNNELYIGEIVIDDDEQEKLWFKKSYKHTLDSKINGLHQISDSEVALFTEDDTWYNVLSDNVYYYNRSKIVPVLKNKSELITLPDSTTTLMPSTNGVVALSYQNFINTTEQSTVNLTQDLTELYQLFKGNVRIINWKQYTLFYENDNDVILIFDNRLQSWWRWTIPIKISTLFVYNTLLYVLSDNGIYEFTNDANKYSDLIENNKKNIDWYVQSQKMYLGANNYYKHIVNLTLASVEEGEQPIGMSLNVKNYRKYVDNGKAENFDYNIDVIRTFVKRLNYAKVCEFQYTLSSDDERAINVPLALSNITVKYKIGGQVR